MGIPIRVVAAVLDQTRAYAARPKVGVERRAIKDAGSRTCIEKVAPFDRKPFDGQTGAKSSAREIR